MFTTAAEAIQTIQGLDGRFSLLTVTWMPLDDVPASTVKRPAPNVGLIEAIEEGSALEGRYSTADELFDALEEDR